VKVLGFLTITVSRVSGPGYQMALKRFTDFILKGILSDDLK